ncbi:hypothetical protein Emag_005820 [Eimeria magna]
MRVLAGISLPLVGLCASEAFTLQSAPGHEAGDIKLFGGGAARLAGEIKQALSGSDPAGFDEALDEDLLPTYHEASILSGVSGPDDEMALSLLETDVDREEDEEEAEEEEDEEEEEEHETEGLSFFEEHDDETAAETDSDLFFSSENSDEETQEETPTSFLEAEETGAFEGDSPSFDPWEHDEEEEEDEEIADENQETGDSLMAAAADPYGDSRILGPSFFESDAETDEETAEEQEDEEQQEEPSFIEEEGTADEEEEEETLDAEQEDGFSFIQLESRKTVKASSRHPKSSFVQAPLAPHDFSDQTSAENEMLAEAGESPMDYGEEESGRTMPHPTGAEAAGEGEEPGASPRGLEEAEGEGGGPSAAEEQSDEIYGGPADPMIRYGGRSEEDVETGGGPSEEGITEEGPSDEETAGGEETLQQRVEETADEKGNAVPPTTEEELAADLQGAFPRLHASRPHVVQRESVCMQKVSPSFSLILSL